ncbi:response regulator [Novosphingobium terrae]|uniref:response regulator n=1 Tax=Novosphingobium terrae TaxID=2726189 RepID=UPI00197CF40E|nr:response regulator [Novosphingobium terrae]
MQTEVIKILVVDDDREICDLLCEYLGDAGLTARSADSGEAMWRVLERFLPDLIVLDLMLPGVDGLELCRTLRERTQIPVIMLTARGAPVDRIIGLEMGADDYIVKPFDPRELLARIKVVLRRIRQFPPEAQIEEIGTLHFEGWRLDMRQRSLIAKDGTVTVLGGADYQMLRLLLRHPHRTLNRDFLHRQIYGRERGPLDRAVDVCISRLRQMLGPTIIRTVRNSGYALPVDVSIDA